MAKVPIPLTALSEEQRVEAYTRFEILRPALEEGVSQAQVARTIHLSKSTVQRWMTRYREQGLAGLATTARKDKGKSRRLPQTAIQLVEGLALQTPPRSAAAIHRQVAAIAKEQGWKPPCYERVRQIIKNLSPALVTYAHQGAAAYREEFDLLYRREATHANAMWQADHTPLDVLLLDETGTPAKPWLTAIEDDYSRMIVGYRLSFQESTALTTALALRQAIWRKEDPRWHASGIPTVFYTDHGSDFTSQTGAQHTYQLAGDSGSSSCVSWSPSGTQVSYVAHSALILANLITSTQRVLVQEPSQNYSSAPVGGTEQTYFGDIDCGTWISEDILLFHRFTGPFPFTITTSASLGAPELAPNTTTMALLRNGTLVDTAGAFFNVSALSQDAAYILLAGPTPGSWELAQASTFTSLTAAHAISCARIHCDLLGFVPHSDEVFGFQYEPYNLSSGSSTSYNGLVFVDPKSSVAQLGPIGLPDGTTVCIEAPPSCNANDTNLEVIQWRDNPNDAIVVYEYSDPVDAARDYYAVTNLHTGKVNWLTGFTDNGIRSQLLGWIP